MTTQPQNLVLAPELARKSLEGGLLSREEGHAVLNWSPVDLLSLLEAAFTVRKAHFGLKVKLNFLVNLQSGLCGEDCGYCSQSRASQAPVEKYKMLTADEVLRAAEKAVEKGASRVCMVASMRGPSDRDVDAVTRAIREVKERFPSLELCAGLGFLREGQGERLAEAGLMAYNHNLNTSEGHYSEICSTHGYADRLGTVEKAGRSGLSVCSGAIFGMGESGDDILDLAYKLRAMEVDSIPLNFLIPFEGNAVSRPSGLSPLQCLKILCLFRLICPAAEIRIAGGREMHLRSLQPLGLYAANSIFLGDYLTTQGRASKEDIEMIRDLGFEIVGEAPLPAVSEELPPVAFTSREARLAR